MKINGEKVIIDSSFPSAPGRKNQIIDTIINRIKRNPADIKMDFDELYLIIDEALTNAMEHGNGWDPGKQVDIKITRSRRYISITIEDEGPGFDSDQFPQNMPHLNPRGRGIKIIRHFCKPVWESPGNKINFCIDLK